MPSFLYKDIPMTYVDILGEIQSELEDFGTCEINGLNIQCGVIPGYEWLMDYT